MGNPMQPQAWLITKDNVLLVSPLFSVSLSPPGSYLKYLKVDGGAGLLEAVSSATMRSVSLGLLVAPYPTQHEHVLHSWGFYIFQMLQWNCFQKAQRPNSINMEKCLEKQRGDWKVKHASDSSFILVKPRTELKWNKDIQEKKLSNFSFVMWEYISSVSPYFVQSSVTWPQIAQKAFSSAGSF